MALKGAEAVNVLHALEKLFVGFHGLFTNPCFFNTPPSSPRKKGSSREEKKDTFKNI